MEKRNTVIYEASREQLLNNLAQLQRLQEEGIHVGKLPEENWDKIVELIENRDEERLAELRHDLATEYERTNSRNK